MSGKAWRIVARHLPKRLAHWTFVVIAHRYIERDDVLCEVRLFDLLRRIEPVVYPDEPGRLQRLGHAIAWHFTHFPYLDNARPRR